MTAKNHTQRHTMKTNEETFNTQRFLRLRCMTLKQAEFLFLFLHLLQLKTLVK